MAKSFACRHPSFPTAAVPLPLVDPHHLPRIFRKTPPPRSHDVASDIKGKTPSCLKSFDPHALRNLCPECPPSAPGVLYPRYDLAAAKAALPADPREYIAARRAELADAHARALDDPHAPSLQGMWALFRHFLPAFSTDAVVSLGEGDTPLLRARGIEAAVVADPARFGVSAFPTVLVKDESGNPTGSFKARGISAAVTKAKENRAASLTIPTAGNAGSALSAYGARAGMPVDVFMPQDTPLLFKKEVRAFGATAHLVEGLIDQAGAAAKAFAAAAPADRRAFDVSTLKEPYRIEGKKTMGYELFFQLGARGTTSLPDVILYPTGGGTGLVGMWKAFAELAAVGWLDPAAKRPRMVAVQSEGCCPIVNAFRAGADRAPRFDGAASYASGIRVPVAVGDYLILAAIRESNGTAVAVSEADIEVWSEWFRKWEGVWAAPEGGACLAALVKLVKDGWVKPNETVVVFNTGSGLKYPLYANEEL
ncbi:threonine synthase [Zopfochytrium polystomum]|nr:threonine synthase [Zopfochytrium polystomum]